jgi:hypothetical protein
MEVKTWLSFTNSDIGDLLDGADNHRFAVMPDLHSPRFPLRIAERGQLRQRDEQSKACKLLEQVSTGRRMAGISLLTHKQVLGQMGILRSHSAIITNYEQFVLVRECLSSTTDVRQLQLSPLLKQLHPLVYTAWPPLPSA